MQSFYANHPGTTLGYVLAFEGRKIAYVPASEIYGDDATSLQDYDEKLGGHIRGADILFHDARHNEQDHAANKNSGHSDAAAVVALAAAHGVQRVVLINADGRYNDDQLDALAAQALTRKTELDRPIEVMLAREGLGLSI
jgi:ribonuclease BN (tRNA processing enzyme)